MRAVGLLLVAAAPVSVAQFGIFLIEIQSLRKTCRGQHGQGLLIERIQALHLSLGIDIPA